MLTINKVTKRFDGKCAVNAVSLEIPEGTVFGLLGTNGAGKSTMLKMLAGILRPDEGSILYDGQALSDKGPLRQRIFYQPDDPFCFFNATPRRMGEFYSRVYEEFNLPGYIDRLGCLELDADAKLNTFSKGMKKQVSFLLAVSSGADYILCDEVFDGLDPIVRETVGNLIVTAARERRLTFLVASHSLRELEEICMQIGILHKGGLLLAKDVSDHAVDIVELFKKETEEIGYDIRNLTV